MQRTFAGCLAQYFAKFFSGRCGCLAEHWDVLQDEATKSESKSGLPMFFDAFAG
jgi:predicted SnoaL-like aldol condensation-catalyzing enzyme